MPRIYILFLIVFTSFFSKSYALQVEKPDSKVTDHFFTFGELEFLEDASGKLSFDEVRSLPFQDKFHPNTLNYPSNENPSSAYWYRIKVDASKFQAKNYLLEFYNQGIEDLMVFIPDHQGVYAEYHTGSKFDFNDRLFKHKNFQFLLPSLNEGTSAYYFRVKSPSAINIVVGQRTLNRFIDYALTEYLFFGIFYGVVLILSFYNLMMYLVIRERHYLYYILYLLSVGLFEVSTDGIAFQYLWPHAPVWNQYATGTFLFLISTAALLFAVDLLQIKTKAPRLYKLIQAVIILRSLFYLVCLLFNRTWFIYSIIEIIPLTIAFFSGIYIWKTGYKPARFFVLAYTFLFLGFIMKVLTSLGYIWFISGPLPHYSMSLGFIGEMVFLSFAIGDKVRLMKLKQEEAQLQMFRQMEENAMLKDTINTELEIQVSERTAVILEKSKELEEKATIIEEQNNALVDANRLLQDQAEEIARMNLLLEKDNEQLQHNIKKVTHDRLMSAEVSFEEFSIEYPDRDACFKFLSDLKWANGYRCKKCSNTEYWAGNLPFSRKCSRCKYDESVIVGTVLQNTRISVNKALYIIFLVYSTKGKISSHKLSELIKIRQNTCWTYSSKIKKLMTDRRKELENAGEKGWSKLLME